MPIIAWLLAGGAAAAGAGYFAKNAAGAVDETANATVKIAIVGIIALIAAKKFKVL